MTALDHTVAYHPGEVLTGFLGRTAARNHVDTPTFCRHMGLNLVRLANGDPATVAELAELTGMEVATLGRGAFVRGDLKLWTLGREVVEPTMLRRIDVRVCPSCLAGDLAGGRGPLAERAWCRNSWLLTHVRTCPVHAVGLVPLRAVDEWRNDRVWKVHDFAGRLLAQCPTGRVEGVLPVRPTYVSGLERYLHERLLGVRRDPWLDGMPLNVVAMFTERLGALVLHGSGVFLNGLDDDGWKAAGDAGFEVMSRGEEGLASSVRALCDWRHPRQGPEVSYLKQLGRFWAFVLKVSKQSDYLPLCRSLVRDFGPHRPVLPERLEPGALEPVARTLYATALDHGRNPVSLGRLLAREGLLDPGHEALTPRQIVLGREALSRVTELGELISLVEAGRRLRLSEFQTGQLFRAGLLGGSPEKVRHGVNVRVERDAPGELVRLLTRDAVGCTEVAAGQGSIAAAAISAQRDMVQVVRLVLEGRLAWVGRLTDVEGLACVLVRRDEVARLLNGNEVLGYSKQQASEILRIAYGAINALVIGGHLPAVPILNKRTSATNHVILPADLDDFRSRYGSLGFVANGWGVHPLAARRRLSSAGVEPAFLVSTSRKADKAEKPIYRLGDVPDWPVVS